MLIEFKKSGVVGLNYGIDGSIEVKEGQAIEVLDKHAVILINDGIAIEAKQAEKQVVSESVQEEVIADDIKPNKRKKKK